MYQVYQIVQADYHVLLGNVVPGAVTIEFQLMGLLYFQPGPKFNPSGSR